MACARRGERPLRAVSFRGSPYEPREWDLDVQMQVEAWTMQRRHWHGCQCSGRRDGGDGDLLMYVTWRWWATYAWFGLCVFWEALFTGGQKAKEE